MLGRPRISARDIRSSFSDVALCWMLALTTGLPHFARSVACFNVKTQLRVKTVLETEQNRRIESEERINIKLFAKEKQLDVYSYIQHLK